MEHFDSFWSQLQGAWSKRRTKYSQYGEWTDAVNTEQYVISKVDKKVKFSGTRSSFGWLQDAGDFRRKVVVDTAAGVFCMDYGGGMIEEWAKTDHSVSRR